MPLSPDDLESLAKAHLSLAPDVGAPPAVLRPLVDYALGHATGSPDHFRRAFRETAHVEGVRDGVFVSWDLDAYCSLFDGPSPDELCRRRVVDALDVVGTIAAARMTLLHGADRFTDLFLLVEEGGAWRIANKAYDRDRIDPSGPGGGLPVPAPGHRDPR